MYKLLYTITTKWTTHPVTPHHTHPTHPTITQHITCRSHIITHHTTKNWTTISLPPNENRLHKTHHHLSTWRHLHLLSPLSLKMISEPSGSRSECQQFPAIHSQISTWANPRGCNSFVCWVCCLKRAASAARWGTSPKKTKKRGNVLGYFDFVVLLIFSKFFFFFNSLSIQFMSFPQFSLKNYEINLFWIVKEGQSQIHNPNIKK